MIIEPLQIVIEDASLKALTEISPGLVAALRPLLRAGEPDEHILNVVGASGSESLKLTVSMALPALKRQLETMP